MSVVGSSASARSGAAIDPRTALGAVRLTVTDLGRSRAFYEQAIGLSAEDLDDGSVALGVAAGEPLIELRGDSSAPPLDRRAPGLFHVAILLPSRADLAFAIGRLATARVALDGASDHLVSEALYLSDPDGNGIEIYRDRPREEWRYVDGQLAMSTLPLDLQSIVAEVADPTEQSQAPTGTKVGHVHLQVSDLDDAEEFYSGVLGFDVMVRGYPGALFVATGGYHHHLGLNTWHSLGSGPAQPGAIGLRSFEIKLPDDQERDRVLARIAAAGIPTEPVEGATLIRDPFGNSVLLSVA
jgi:catechol 2,3-dioxygenase